ncbi:uncharacterized protein VTP21DRAFT_1529 [Calcarisporiella thermophila]|uniref:uncharacterized protein n=1 Tax=Calcarisporiella thermophila TaxID=911321 RepID=UPI003742A8A9
MKRDGGLIVLYWDSPFTLQSGALEESDWWIKELNRDPWSPVEIQHHINWKELKSIELCLHSFSALKDKTLWIRTDSTTTLAYVSKFERTRSPQLDTPERVVWAERLSQRIHLIAEHIPSSQNTETNGIRKNQETVGASYNRSLCEQTRELTSSLLFQTSQNRSSSDGRLSAVLAEGDQPIYQSELGADSTDNPQDEGSRTIQGPVENHLSRDNCKEPFIEAQILVFDRFLPGRNFPQRLLHSISSTEETALSSLTSLMCFFQRNLSAYARAFCISVKHGLLIFLVNFARLKQELLIYMIFIDVNSEEIQVNLTKCDSQV